MVDLKHWKKVWHSIFWTCIIVFFSCLVVLFIIELNSPTNTALVNILRVIMYGAFSCGIINTIIGIFINYRETKAFPSKVIITLLILVVFFLILKLVTISVDKRQDEMYRNNYENNLKEQGNSSTLVDLKHNQNNHLNDYLNNN